MPGLATRGDGRWDYPVLSLPALPPTLPPVQRLQHRGGPPRRPAKPCCFRRRAAPPLDKELDGGWTSVDQYVSEYVRTTGQLRTALRDDGLRHIAARGWTMPDGTSTRVYLLQFTSVGVRRPLQDSLTSTPDTTPGAALTGAADAPCLDDAATATGRPWRTPTASVFAEPKPYGAAQVRQAYVAAGDTVALIVQSRKGGGTPPFPSTRR